MKVLLHCVYYPPEIGGLESHVAGLAEGLAARGHAVGIITSRSRSELPRIEMRNGVQVERTWFPSRSPLGWALHALGSIPKTIRRARRADILHAQTFASVVPVAVAARLAGRPWVASFHTSHFLERARRPAWSRVLGLLVRWPHHAFAASTEIADVAMKLAPGREVETLVNGVDTELFRPTSPAFEPGPGERWIAVPRRLVRKNGVEFLVRAIPLVREKLPGVRFLLLGDGPERERLESLCSELGVQAYVRFAGAQPHGAMPSLLASCEIAVVPSLMEATSVAALEAMACARPVVASRVGGLPEIVDEEVGTLVPPGDPPGLAAGILRLLQSEDLVKKGREARLRVERSWSNARLVDRHLRIYEDLVAGGRGEQAKSGGGS
jgi:glycosyltransferase involved in cell wall biosynthesis